jgi:hypothetical protein
MFFFEWCNVLMHIYIYIYIYIYMYVCVCLFACVYSSSLCVAIRSRFVSELRGIDGQASATKWSGSLSSTKLNTLRICLVKACVL